MKLTHPDAKHPIDVPPDAAPMYLSQGWTAAKTTKTSTARAGGDSGTAPRTTTKKEEA